MPDPETTSRDFPCRSRFRRSMLVLAILCLPGLLGNRCDRDDLQSASGTATTDLRMTLTARSYEAGVVQVRGALCCSQETLFDPGGENLRLGPGESLAASVGYGRRTLARGESGSNADAYVFTFERVTSEAPIEFICTTAPTIRSSCREVRCRRISR